MPGGGAGAAASAFRPPSPLPKKPADAEGGRGHDERADAKNAQEEDDLRKTGLGGKQDLDRGRRASTMSKGLGSLRAFADFMSGKEDPTKSDEAVHL